MAGLGGPATRLLPSQHPALPALLMTPALAPDAAGLRAFEGRGKWSPVKRTPLWSRAVTLGSKSARAGDLIENVGDPRDQAPGACAGVAADGSGLCVRWAESSD